jgi:perosamine synthetase
MSILLKIQVGSLQVGLANDLYLLLEDFGIFLLGVEPILAAVRLQFGLAQISKSDECRSKTSIPMSFALTSHDAWRRYRKDGSWDYAVVEAGFKYNLPDVLAAIGLHQLDRADDMWAARSKIAARYNKAFEGFDGIAPLAQRSGIDHSWHLYVIQLDVDHLQIDRSQFISMLGDEGIGTSVHYRPLHLHPLYADRFGYTEADFPNASNVFPRLVSLPIYPTMSEDAIERVISVVKALIGEHRA